MIEDFIQEFIFEYSSIKLYLLTFLYFCVLYFLVGSTFLAVCKILTSKGITSKIIDKEVPRKQLWFEIKYSILSIFVFGFSVLPIIYLIRANHISLLPNTVGNVLIGVVLLTIWNEVHFFTVHKIMHRPFFMKYVHKIHHQSYIPTVYSVYSFHWFEALLLSTVPLTITPFVPFSPVAIFIYPLASILLNYAGHCNYRFGMGKGPEWTRFGTIHNSHHSKGDKVYGFATHLLDKIFNHSSKNNS